VDERWIDTNSAQTEQQPEPRHTAGLHTWHLDVDCATVEMERVPGRFDALPSQPLVRRVGPVATRDDDRSPAEFCLNYR
jgi:hypothetical protein